jgi:1-phosphofructokinase family hexose kinase
MIVTVTPNTAIDRTLFVPSFRLNHTIRAGTVAMGMGGKPADASWILGELGIPSLALGFAAGATGHQMETMLRARGVATDFVWVGGETRVNTLIVCQDGGGQSTITVESLVVMPEDVAALIDRYRIALDEATCIILGSSLPGRVDPAIYTSMVREARARDIPVVFDASGPALRAGLEGRPAFVKPNRAELEELTGQTVPTLEAAYHAACELQEKFGASLVVTLGEGVLAGLAAALSRREPLEEGLRLGFAAAAAVLMTPATADCRRADVEKLLPTVELIPYP